MIKATVDYVIHAASQASNIQFETDPVGTINANLLGTASVLEFAKESGSKSVLIVSSLKVYGDLSTGKERLRRTDIGYIDFTSYKNCYAMGKRASETLGGKLLQRVRYARKDCPPQLYLRRKLA